VTRPPLGHAFAAFGCMAAMGGLALAAGQPAMADGHGETHAGGRQLLVHDGVARSYVVRLPHAPANGGAHLPLVLVLHGGGGNADNAERMTGFTEKARREGFIVVYPEGTGRAAGRRLTWNAGHCCGRAMRERVDDVGFIAALIDRLGKEYPVDAKRVYATGMSNGGMMAHRLGIALSGRLAAVAPVVAALFGDEPRPADPVSALMINGLQDRNVPAQGGPPGGRFPRAWDGTPVRPARAQAQFWADADGCADGPREDDRGAFRFSAYRCPAGKAVELYLVKEGGHAWPGGRKGSRLGDEPGSALDATDLIWSFFKAHPK
jgi:polyhydroxybutyrate depolymerase